MALASGLARRLMRTDSEERELDMVRTPLR
jgi:hypothetical protein